MASAYAPSAAQMYNYGHYGAAPDASSQMHPAALIGNPIKGAFLKGGRRRLNIVPIIICLFAPWALFCCAYWLSAFSVHYENPTLYYFCHSWLLGVVIVIALTAVSKKVRWFSNAEEAPSWLIFLALSMFTAWAVGFFVGGLNYAQNMQRYYDMNNLNNYTNVYPNRMRGQQLMDAGLIDFAPGTKLDVSKSMGFRNSRNYCVAPITLGATPPATYDFWAVGTDCCDSNQANFHCENFNNPRASGGLRLMLDGDRAFYRLAVQQAEAAYKVKAVHPLFFHWVQEPMVMVESWKYKGQSEFVAWVFSAFVFQTFIVGFTTIVFSKLGHA